MTLAPHSSASAQIRADRYNAPQFKPCYPPQHTCGAPLQHDLLLWIYLHPSAMLKHAADDMNKKYSLITKTAHKLRSRHDYAVLCPFCFSPARSNHVCSACGVEFYGHSTQARVEFDSQSPVHTLLPGQGLGSSLRFYEYQKLARLSISGAERETLTSSQANKLVNNLAAVMKQQGNGKEDSLVSSIKSDVLQALKETCPDDRISDEASSIVEDEVMEFRLKYQLKHTPHGLRESIAARVIGKLEVLHPELRGRLRLPERTSKRKKETTRLPPKPSALEPAFDFEGEEHGLLGDERNE